MSFFHSRLLPLFTIVFSCLAKLWLLSAVVVFIGGVDPKGMKLVDSSVHSDILVKARCRLVDDPGVATCLPAFCTKMQGSSAFTHSFQSMMGLFKATVWNYGFIFLFLVVRDALLLFVPRLASLKSSSSSPSSRASAFLAYFGPSRPLQILNFPLFILLLIQLILFVSSAVTFDEPRSCYKDNEGLACDCRYRWARTNQEELVFVCIFGVIDTADLIMSVMVPGLKSWRSIRIDGEERSRVAFALWKESQIVEAPLGLLAPNGSAGASNLLHGDQV